MGLQGPCLGCAVSAMCQGERGMRGMENEKSTTSCGDDFRKKIYLFLYFTTAFFILVFLSAQLFLLFFFLLILICFIFSHTGGKHLSTVLLSAEESHSLPGLFLGAKQQVVLIYRDFITRKECFQNACLLLTTPRPRASMHAVRVLSS